MTSKILIITILGLGLSTTYPHSAYATECSQINTSLTCRRYWEGCQAINSYTVPDSKKANCLTWDTDTSTGCGCATCSTGYTATTVNETYGTFGLKLTKRCTKTNDTLPGDACTTANCTTALGATASQTTLCRSNTTCTSCNTTNWTGTCYVYSDRCQNGAGITTGSGYTVCAGSCATGMVYVGALDRCTKLCSDGTYLASISATTCTTCPKHQNTAANSKYPYFGILSCYIPSTKSFSDTPGTYNFTSDCSYSS